jgi:hypothetical protein
MVLSISTDQAALSQKSVKNNDTSFRALNSPTLKKSERIVQQKENVNNTNHATAEDQIADDLEGHSEAEIDRVLGNYSNSRSHKSSKHNYEADVNTEIEKKTVIKSFISHEAPILDNGPSCTNTSPVPVIKKKPESAVSISKRVAEFANKPNLKFAFENAMFSNKSKQSDMADNLEREKERDREERDRERERDDRQRDRNYSHTTSKKSMPLPTDHYSKPPSPLAYLNEALLSTKKPDKQAKKPSAAVHKPPPRRGSRELIIDRTDYGNRQGSIFDRRKSSTNTSTSTSTSTREEEEKIERYSEPIPSFFRSPMGRRLSKDMKEPLHTPKSRGFSPGKMNLGFNQLSVNKSPMKRMGFNPFYTPKGANGQQCL